MRPPNQPPLLKRKADEVVDEMRAFCRAHLAHFKAPKHIKFVNEFPTTVTGKIQKFKIRG